MEETQNDSIKKPMTDEERIKLATKLDSELDDFINGLEKRQYTEGWPEDRWQEEFEKHPFFMKKAPQPGDEVHPLLEGIQQLKYDPEENTAEELAVSYKEDGNFNFKHKNYRLAILSYTEGIKQKHNNKEVIASLYNNRSAANFHLKNYRSTIRDCELALKNNPNHPKVQIRAAYSYYETENWDKCVEFCDAILLKTPENSEILQLRQAAILGQKMAERDLRRRKKNENTKKGASDKILIEIKRRGVKMSSDNIIPSSPQLEDAVVHFDPDLGQIVWPVGLVYPEVGTIDFIREFCEQNTFQDQLREVLSEPASWDQSRRYRIDTINLYFEESERNGPQKLHFVPLGDTLSQTISRKEYIVKDATPHFLVLEKGSPAEASFLKRYT